MLIGAGRGIERGVVKMASSYLASSPSLHHSLPLPRHPKPRDLLHLLAQLVHQHIHPPPALLSQRALVFGGAGNDRRTKVRRLCWGARANIFPVEHREGVER